MTTETLAQPATLRRGFDRDYLPEFEAKLFYTGPEITRKLANFFVLLLLATAIATFGLMSDSTATVIGSMIIAPLMGPIMATAAAVVMGHPQRTLASLALVALGAITVIITSWLLAWLVPSVTVSFTENAEIVSRIAPGLMALLTALPSGAAGAYITARREIADSIGGVAIAISLVPPLCVVGISLAYGQYGAAGGAALLFLTNFLAILFAGGVTFWISGLGSAVVLDSARRVRRRHFALIGLATMLVAVPLAFTSYDAYRDAHEETTAKTVVSEWLQGTEYELTLVNVDGEAVNVAALGSGATRSLDELAAALGGELGHTVTVQLRIIPTTDLSAPTTAAP